VVDKRIPLWILIEISQNLPNFIGRSLNLNFGAKFFHVFSFPNIANSSLTEWLTPLRGAGRQRRGGRDSFSIMHHF
jgi:hypothetical protein